ncbi:hypothetical protein BGZ46_008893 [Entomortierella lignicola]|nr:hypothetical protein BGZ46_008893 [Entomortierella lignicola]
MATINDNCYSHHNDATATVTLSPSSIQLSSSLHTIAGSDSPSKPKSSNIHSVLSEDREAQELKLQSDDAGSLPELSETHGSCSEEDQVVQDQVQTRSNAPPPRAKFFLCDDSDDFESDMDQEPISYKFSSIKRSSLVDQEIEELDHDGDCEDFDAADDQHDDNEEEDYFGKKIPIITRSRYPSKESNSPHPTFNNANMGRRQSLLSDLLLAEKQQRSLQRVAVPLSSSSASNSKCPSANNSDGESAALHSNMAMNPMPSPQHQQHHRRESHMERNISEHKAVSPQLMRTKKVYKNLSELAKTKTPTTTSQQHYSENLTTTPTRKSSLSVSSPCAAKATAAASKNAMKTTTSTTTAIASPSLSSSPSPTVSTNSSCILSASPIVATNSWSRTQVQVQLQSLVAQSTSTAQRALMGASATLSDVLFRTAH